VSIKGEPTISVIIPLYNQRDYVGEAIESVLNQSYSNIELIVVNDGSTDDPSKILKKYKKDITLINQENKGLAGARNVGIKNSSGEYIQFLDADDFLDKDKIRLQVEFAESRNSDISYCEILQYEHNSRRLSLNYIGEIKDMFPHLYNFWYPYPLPVHSLLIKREVFEKFGLFDEELKANEDRHFFSKLAFKGVIFDCFPFIGGFRRLHQYNMNKDKFHMMENTIRYYKKINKEIGGQYFIEKFSYTGYEMMRANLTHIYSVRIVDGTSRKELNEIRKLFRREGIKFYSKPIPFGFRKFKSQPMFLYCYLKRWRRKFASKKNQSSGKIRL